MSRRDPPLAGTVVTPLCGPSRTDQCVVMSLRARLQQLSSQRVGPMFIAATLQYIYSIYHGWLMVKNTRVRPAVKNDISLCYYSCSLYASCILWSVAGSYST